jgi:hypothetical protein
MKEKPYRVTMTYLKNVAKHHRPPVYEEQAKNETFWGLSPNDAMARAYARYGNLVTVKTAAILPGWADVDFSAMAGMDIMTPE